MILLKGGSSYGDFLLGGYITRVFYAPRVTLFLSILNFDGVTDQF